jgi:hypothetical protein
MAFVIPGIAAIGCGFAFMLSAKIEGEPPARRKATQVELPPALLARVFLIMTLAATSASLLFNFSTNGNYELLTERLAATTRDPAVLGLLLAIVYTVAVDRAARRGIDDRPRVVEALVPLHHRAPDPGAVARRARAELVALRDPDPLHADDFRRHPLHRRDDRALRGRPHALARGRHAPHGIDRRLLDRGLGARPIVKSAGFDVLLLTMAAISVVTFAVMTLLPETTAEAARAMPAPGAAE